MTKAALLWLSVTLGVVAIITVTFIRSQTQSSIITGAPPNGIPESEAPPLDRWQQLRASWTRPAGPAKVALQAGHWKNQEVPEELDSLKENTGATGEGYTEVAANLAIAEKTAELLRAQGITVDILPATVPPDYWADAFIAIHADGSTDSRTSGFKIARPWRDLSGKADSLVSSLEMVYQDRTRLPIDPNITRNMRGYYAFAWWRYDHSIHPMTTAAIVETGFITSPHDRKIIVHQQDLVAQALAEGITQFLNEVGVLAKSQGSSQSQS